MNKKTLSVELPENGETEFPKFHDYVREKQPELDEDTITKMENVILRESGGKGVIHVAK